MHESLVTSKRPIEFVFRYRSGSFKFQPYRFKSNSQYIVGTKSELAMDPKHAGEMLKHLEKQHELLVDARQSMLDELHKYQIEEEMLMRKLNEVMSAHKEAGRSGSSDIGSRDGGALVCTTSNGEVADGSMRKVAAATCSASGDVKKAIVYTRREKL